MQNNLIFTIETNIKNVINELEIITNENILNAEIRYFDEHGYEKVANLLNVQKLEDKTLLTFDYFYSDKFDFVVDGNISENSIQDIKIITLNQNEFYESQDVDTKMTKEGLIATTLCGQYSSKSPNYMLDGQNNTNFHSADYRNYAPGTYGDVVIQLDKIQLVDKLSMITNSSGNGRIKSYEILYRTTSTENWKKVFEQVTEQSGTGREARFKPVLAKEFCIRVTNGQNHFIVIYEVDLFKHNFIDTRISNLFSDSAETVIKQSVTLEEIEDLEAEVTTESYIERLKNAKELYILGLPQNCFEIPLDEEKIFDKIQFITTERVLKVNLKYLDSYGIERVVETDFEVLGNVYTINTNKIMTSNASLVMFGFSEIENINTNNYEKSEFYIDEDITTEISKDKILASTTCPNGTSYPLSNMFDGNLSSSFHSNNYVEYCDVYFKLNKEYLIDKLSLISYRSNTSGLIKKFKVLVKEMNTNEWVELGEHTITLHENKWLDVKNKNSYLTNEVCLRIEDSVNKWSIVNELKIFIHSNLEKEINNLYSDENYEKLREGVSYEEILNLEAKNLVTLEFVEKIEKAKELYISNLNQNYFSLSLKEEKIFDKVQFSTPERVLRAYIKYVDSYGIERLIKSNFENLGDIYTLNIKKILTSNASLIVFGVSKIENILTNEYPKSEFYLNEDVDTRITSDKITATSANSNSSYPVTNIFDKNINSEHRTSYYTDYYDIYLKLDKEYLIDRLRLISFRGHVSGLINSFKVLLKDMNTENDWIELGENTRSTYTNSWNKVSGKPYLTDEVCIRVTDSVEKWIILNEVELFIHNNLEKDIDLIFFDETFETLKEDVTYEEILSLEKRVLITPEYIDKIDRAKKLYLDKKIPVYFKLEVEEKSVMNEIKIETKGKIYNAEVSYKDEYGYLKIAEVLEIKNIESGSILKFEYFYSDKFDLMVHGDITESLVENIKITKLNQNEFYEDEDVDVRLDKTKLTAVTYCGQYSSNEPSHAIDGDVNTGFHSSTYTNFGDFAIELEKPYLLNRLEMITRSSGNGRIKSYEVLYKTSKSEEWKKVFEQLTEEAGVNRIATFKPVLAIEVCIRVTNGHGRFVMINELDLFKYNSLEKRISNLFIDSEENAIKLELTLEEIETLEREVVTTSYKSRVAKAKELYIESLVEKEFLVPLNEETILDRIQFTTSERVLKVKVKYLDNYFITKTLDVECVRNGEYYNLVFEKIMTKNLVVLMYGVKNIENIATNSFSKLEFCLNDDVDSRILYKNIEAKTDLPNNSYPISNMFDGDIATDFRCNHSKEYCDIFFKLDKEYLIDRLRLISFRSSTSGLINKFKVLLKDINIENSWVELGSCTVSDYKNDWHLVEGKPYLTNEVCLRIEDSVNGWTLINELEIFIHNNLEASINKLFKDNSFKELRADITYEEILNLSSKVKLTREYKDKIKLAKELYLVRTTKKNYVLNSGYDSIVDELTISYKAPLESFVDYKIEYIDTFGERKYIYDFEILSQSDKVVNLKFEKILTKNIEVTISFILQDEYWKSSYAKIVEIDQSPYYIVDDNDIAYDNNKISALSHCGVWSVGNEPDKMLDGLKETMFHSKKPGKVEYIFAEAKVINEFWIDISHPNGYNGKIGAAKLYFKETDEQDWILLEDYSDDHSLFGMKLFKFQNVLAKRFCIDVESCHGGVVIMNRIGFNIYSSLSAKIDNLFNDNAQSLREGVTLKMIEKLSVKVSTNKLLKAKLQIAKMLLSNSNVLPLEIYGYKALEKTSAEYFGPTVSNNTGDAMLGKHYIHSNTDYIIAVNRDVQMGIGNQMEKPGLNTTVVLKKGINHINVPYEGQVFFRGSRKEKLEYYSLNEKNSLAFRYGYDKASDLFNKDYIETQLEVNQNSNLAYLEGSTYIGAVKFDWLKSNFEAKNLAKHVEIADEYLDFLYYLDNVQGQFKEHIPYKRLMWLGLPSNNPCADTSIFGGNTSYSGSSSPMVPRSTFDMGNSWAIGHELGHEIDPNDYLMGLFGEVANNWYAEQGRHEFVKDVRCKPNTQNIALEPRPISEYGYFDKLAVFYKLRLFYPDNSFFQKLNAFMQETRANNNAEAADNYSKFFTRILKRDMSSYLIKYGFDLSESAIAYCNQYPAPAIELQYLTYDNHLEFIKEEAKLFNQKYKSALKIK